MCDVHEKALLPKALCGRSWWGHCISGEHQDSLECWGQLAWAQLLLCKRSSWRQGAKGRPSLDATFSQNFSLWTGGVAWGHITRLTCVRLWAYLHHIKQHLILDAFTILICLGFSYIFTLTQQESEFPLCPYPLLRKTPQPLRIAS